LEAVIVTLRNDLQKKDMKQNNTRILENIINNKIPYYERYRLRYNQIHIEKGSSSRMIEKEIEPRIYEKTVRCPSNKEEDMNTQEEYYRDTAPPRRFKSQYKQQKAIKIPQEEEGFIREAPLRISSTPMYQTNFLGSCYNFGHKDVNCRDNTKNIRNDEGYTINSYPRRSHEAQNKSYNRFG
jgi:hypothetical protein